jgi:hypothetical protein
VRLEVLRPPVGQPAVVLLGKRHGCSSDRIIFMADKHRKFVFTERKIVYVEELQPQGVFKAVLSVLTQCICCTNGESFAFLSFHLQYAQR